MKSLKCKEVTMLQVNYSDLEDFVNQFYKIKDYSFTEKEQCGNDTMHDFKIDGKLDRYGKEALEKLKSGSDQGVSNQDILQCLCFEGHIKPGTYIVRVCW
jgi:hypothetical protein